MALRFGRVLPLLALRWQSAEAMRAASNDTAGVSVPGVDYSDEEIAKSLESLAEDFPMIDIRGFVDMTHQLYFDASLDASLGNPYQTQHVHFHNWDHGRNVWSFAQWYVSQPGVDMSSQDKFLLALAALSHDVMHPGTPNSAEIVRTTFLPNVNQWSGKRWGLEDYAKSLLEETSLKDTMRAALGCDFKNCSTLNDTLVLVDRSPQEVLHAWITMELLKRYAKPIYDDKSKLQTVVVPILMTSITAHFAVLFASNAPDPSKIAAHVHAEAEAGKVHKLGLLLHLFDMGYLCQTGMGEGTPGLTDGLMFAARYLVESGNPPAGLSDWGSVKGGQIFFGKTVVSSYLTNLGDSNVIPRSSDVLEQLKSGTAKYLEQINAQDENILKKLLVEEVKAAKELNTEAYNKLRPLPPWLEAAA